jgi:hypothetical protein
MPCTRRRMPCTRRRMPCTRRRMPCTRRRMPCTRRRMPCARRRMPCARRRMPCTRRRMPCTRRQMPCTPFPNGAHGLRHVGKDVAETADDGPATTGPAVGGHRWMPTRPPNPRNGSRRGFQNEERALPSGRTGLRAGTQGLTLRVRSWWARRGCRPGPLTRGTGHAASPSPREDTRLTDCPTAVSRPNGPSDAHKPSALPRRDPNGAHSMVLAGKNRSLNESGTRACVRSGHEEFGGAGAAVGG